MVFKVFQHPLTVEVVIDDILNEIYQYIYLSILYKIKYEKENHLHFISFFVFLSLILDEIK